MQQDDHYAETLAERSTQLRRNRTQEDKNGIDQSRPAMLQAMVSAEMFSLEERAKWSAARGKYVSLELHVAKSIKMTAEELRTAILAVLQDEKVHGTSLSLETMSLGLNNTYPMAKVSIPRQELVQHTTSQPASVRPAVKPADPVTTISTPTAKQHTFWKRASHHSTQHAPQGLPMPEFELARLLCEDRQIAPLERKSTNWEGVNIRKWRRNVPGHEVPAFSMGGAIDPDAHYCFFTTNIPQRFDRDGTLARAWELFAEQGIDLHVLRPNDRTPVFVVSDDVFGTEQGLNAMRAVYEKAVEIEQGRIRGNVGIAEKLDKSADCSGVGR